MIKDSLFACFLSSTDSNNVREPVIGPEGIERFCHDLGVEPDDVCNLLPLG